jgi:hypothetical protein
MAKDFLKIFKGINFAGQASAPSSPANGDVYYDTTLQKLRCYQNGVWVDLSDSDGTVLLADGSAANPSLSFTNSPTTGLFRKAADSLGFSAAGVEVGSYSSTGAFTIGRVATGVQQTLNTENGPILASFTAAFNSSRLFYTDSTTGAIGLAGGTGGSSGSNIYVFGSSHSTNANQILFRLDTSTIGSVNSSGAWTLGASGGTQTHTFNGARVDLTGSSSNFNQIVSDPGAAGTFQLRLNNNTSQVNIRGGSGSTSAGLTAYGSSHATRANQLSFHGASGTEYMSMAATGDLTLSTSTAGGIRSLVIENTSTAVDIQRADLLLKVDDNSTGSARIRFQTGPSSTQYTTIGNDAADSDSFIIAKGNGLGSQINFKVSSNSIITLGVVGNVDTHNLNGSYQVSRGMVLTGSTLTTTRVFDTGAGSGHVTNTTQIGIDSRFTATSNATAGVEGIRSNPTTVNAVYTVPYLSAFYANNSAKGASSTITRHLMYGGTTPNQGTNNAFISDNVSFTGNWFINSTSTNPSRIGGNLGIGTDPSNDIALRLQRTIPGSATTKYSLWNTPVFSSTTTSAGQGVFSRVELENASFTMANAYNFIAGTPIKGASATLTRYHAFYSSTWTGVATNAAMISDNTSFTGDWVINSTNTNPSLLSGQIALAGTLINSSALVQVGRQGSNQTLLSGVNQRGLEVDIIGNTSATTNIIGINSVTRSQASSFTSTLLRGYNSEIVIGASSTVTRAVNYYISTLTVSGTLNNRASIADNVSFTGNWFINSTSTNPSLFSGTLEVNTTTGVFKPPRMTTAQRDLLTPAAGDVIYNTTTNKHQGHDGTNWNDFY